MLPQEIIEEIVDLLQHDRGTLKACALTAPEFVPRTRIYLFHRLVINNERERLPSVYHGLFKDNYIVLNAVTHVQLCIDSTLPNWSDAEAKALSDSLRQFTNLEHLSITFTHINPGIAKAISFCASRVKTLVLESVKFRWESDIVSFAHHFLSLETVYLDGIFLNPYESQDGDPVTVAPEDTIAPLRAYPKTLIWTVGLDGHDAMPIFFRRNVSLQLSKVGTLEIRVQATNHHMRAHMFKLLEQCDSLRRLSIIPCPVTMSSINSGELTSTRESTASFWSIQQSLYVWVAYSVFTTFQCKLDLLELMLYTDEHWRDESRPDFWQSFDGIVVGQLTPSLPTSICICISGDQGLPLEELVFEDMRDFLQTHLPLLQASGVLSIVHKHAVSDGNTNNEEL